jgi:hypothetical protein
MNDTVPPAPYDIAALSPVSSIWAVGSAVLMAWTIRLICSLYGPSHAVRSLSAVRSFSASGFRGLSLVAGAGAGAGAPQSGVAAAAAAGGGASPQGTPMPSRSARGK